MKSEYRVNYYLNGDMEYRWKLFPTMLEAVSRAKEMIESGNYTIIGIQEEWYSNGQD